jgi:hypothetical protein
VAKIVSTKVDENFNLVVLRSDDTLEIFPLREGFERYWNQTAGGYACSE